jgi:D-alanyl-D-alanine carboxypeptidase
MRHIFLVLTFILFTSSLFSQPVDRKRLDSLFTLYNNNQFFFSQVLLKRAGGLLYEGSSGYQNLDAQVKNTQQTQFLIGSITKSYTAAMIMQLVDEGKLRLNDKLSGFFPEIPNADRITLEILLRHRSGLFNYTDHPDFVKEVSGPVSKLALLLRFQNLKIVFEPDTKYEYSNTNYMLLGFIIEKVTGRGYADELSERILNKIGLRSTQLGRPDNKTNLAKSYTYMSDKWMVTQPEWNIDWARAAGGISSTAADVALFYEALFNGKLVSAVSLAKMTEMKEGYGLGLIAMPFGNRRFYGHTGGIESFSSIAGYNPDDKTMFVRLINGQRALDPNDMSIQVLNAAYGLPVAFPNLAIRPGVKVNMDLVTRYVGTYVAPGFSLEINVFIKDDQLHAQATGQGAFPLKGYSNTDFGFEEANIKLSFFEQDQKIGFHFSQGSLKFDFTKKP